MRAMDTEVNRVIRKQLGRIMDQLDRLCSVWALIVSLSVDYSSLMFVSA